ncbi:MULTISPECIES: hypothetical protein [Moorena]|uniref:hypothetical protein n=1 Tax=Moorena TaxID=1155738 RepID=UPI0012B63A95|nr:MULTISPECIES: hypothetical protein [Moorena]NEQ04643.1 hypothetical protein [Moorena sp. SIO4E2]NER86168.1 hypothetical protein [Moorena sp. SIO3A2]NES45093.1 hypothetical protein [Moorena sp. SIO2C4]NET62944.1 hypothetical protein [Moorena sp. SIO1G6]
MAKRPRYANNLPYKRSLGKNNLQPFCLQPSKPSTFNRQNLQPSTVKTFNLQPSTFNL